MLLPPLTAASGAPPSPSAGAVVLTGQADFGVAYDASAALAALEQANWPEVAIVLPDMADAVIPEMPAPAAVETNGDEKVAVSGLTTLAEPVRVVIDPEPKAAQAVQPADDHRPPLKLAPHVLVQMQIGRPAVPAGWPVADLAKPLMPAPVLPGQRDGLPGLVTERATVPDLTGGTILRDIGLAKDVPPFARSDKAAVVMPPVSQVAVAAPVLPPAPLSAVAIPAPTPPSVAMEHPLQPSTSAAVAKRPELVVPAIKLQDPKSGAMAGGGLPDTPVALSSDTASVSGTSRPADIQSAPGLARHAAQQLAVTVTQAAGQPTEIALNPEELGRVRMSMSMTDGILMLQINAERPETTELLRRHIDTLAQEFRNLGYSDISFDFGEGRAQDQDGHKAGPLADHIDETAENHTTDHVVARSAHGGLDLRL
ncbi:MULTISPECIES: flagellar hook-length control protein FliK [unclassified Yoonia]|uniref:flagellar hook-length control protein FliK n=1 Tax=unclassified Yoonia TaxID=2629118 RepID=UPI002AFEF88C|nr:MULTISPECIES: flagellar hook-length control protein FliK [unclassified Yoonia]